MCIRDSSSCHWCHVMALECFENQKIADYLNEFFISVKVDREERPDIDRIYMSACQAVTGAGGWPLSVFINHDKKPFYAGTYFPPWVFLQILKNINRLWQKNRESLMTNSEIIIEKIKPTVFNPEKGDPTQGKMCIRDRCRTLRRCYRTMPC